MTKYGRIVVEIFFTYYEDGISEFEFTRDEIAAAAERLDINPPKNLGDVLYSFRYRQELPDAILATEPEGMEWIIEGVGRAAYKFRLAKQSRIEPNPSRVTIKVPDATPQIIKRYALNDEQALLAIVRYNRLIDLFLGITTYSLQNHLRTTISRDGVKGIQIEIDELYVGVDSRGIQYVLPVQAKGGNDKVGVVQAKQDIDYCTQKLPDLICRPIAAQFMDDNRIALFELTLERDEVLIVQEQHYKLVEADAITPEDLQRYSRN